MINDVETAVNFIRSLPPHHGNRGRVWRSDPSGCALLVQHVLATEDHAATMRQIAERLGGMNYQTIRQLVHGHDASGMRWPDLRAALTSLGASWLPDSGDRRAMGAPPARGQNEERATIAAGRQATQDTHEARIAAAVEAIRRVPVGRSGRKIWASDPAGVAVVALVIARATDRTAAIREVSDKAGVNESVLYRFVAGMRSGKAWPELRQQMKRLGVEPTPLRWAAKKHKAGAANGKDHAAPVALQVPASTVLSFTDAEPTSNVASLAPRPGAPSRATAADPKLIVQTGDVVKWRQLDGGDIEVVTRRLLPVGSPEYTEFVRRVLPDCGTVRS